MHGFPQAEDDALGDAMNKLAAANPEKILVVDDDRNVRGVVRLCLEQVGYDVNDVSNGADALEWIHNEPLDLVLLDLAMPNLDGMTVLAELRSFWPGYKTRAIVLTAHGSMKTAIEALRLGASDFLEKPFVPEDLRRSVASVLQDAPSHLDLCSAGYDQTLQLVREALRERRFIVAERQLMKAGTIAADDPAFLNLGGILHECHGRIECARRFYERAAKIDRSYQPAQQNLKRLGEIRRHKKSKLKVAFGDDDQQPTAGYWLKQDKYALR